MKALEDSIRQHMGAYLALCPNDVLIMKGILISTCRSAAFALSFVEVV
jgi:hypothetical protein